MKRFLIALSLVLAFSQSLWSAPCYYNYKKEAPQKKSQISFTNLDMKKLTEVEMTFVGMEFLAQGWSDFVSLNKPVTLYASASTDLRVKYKNRPSYEYDTKIKNKPVHFKAKNYFYWTSYFQILLAPDKKYGTKLRSRFNGIENTLSSYIVEKESKENSRTFKFNKRITDKKETIDAVIASEQPEIPANLKYCSDNLVLFKYNIHFGSGKPLFGRGNPNEVKDVTVTLYATLQSLTFADGNKVTYKTAPKPKIVKPANKASAKNKKSTAKNKGAKSKAKVKNNKPSKSASKPVSKTASTTTSKTNVEEEKETATLSASEIAPRSDAELDDDLGAEVVFVTGAENSLKSASSIAPRTDSQLDDDLVED